jgi:hypothetical protein
MVKQRGSPYEGGLEEKVGVSQPVLTKKKKVLQVKT